MTFPSEPPTNPAGSQELLHTRSFPTSFDEGANTRMWRLTNNYYSWRFKYEWLQEQIRQKQSLGENLTDFDQHMLHSPFPTMAQYLAYLSHLDAVRNETRQTDEESM